MQQNRLQKSIFAIVLAPAEDDKYYNVHENIKNAEIVRKNNDKNSWGK